MACPESLATQTHPPYALTSLFDTRGYRTLTGSVSRGVQALGSNAELFGDSHKLVPWTSDTAHPYDVRSNGTHYAHSGALAERMRFKPQYDALVAALHLQAQAHDRKPRTLGYLSLISSAVFTNMIFELHRSGTEISRDKIPEHLLNTSENAIGISYIAHIWLALGVNPKHEISADTMNQFVMISGMLIGKETVCPIRPEFFINLITQLAIPDSSHASPDFKINPDPRCLKLGRLYETFRLATAIPWSLKPTDIEWADWPKNTGLSAENEHVLLQCEHEAESLLGQPYIPRAGFTGFDINQMRREKTVFRDDLNPLLHQLLPKEAFLE